MASLHTLVNYNCPQDQMLEVLGDTMDVVGCN